MDTKAVFFTMWIGSLWCLPGTNVLVGRALPFGQSNNDVDAIRPTIDAEYEVVNDDVADQ